MKQAIAIVGAGAVGTFLGWKFARAGMDVHLVARSNFQHLRQNGLNVQVDGEDQPALHLNVFPSVDKLPEVDTIIVATKTTDIVSVSRELAKYQPAAVIVAVHNGLTPEKRYVSAGVRNVLLSSVAYMTVTMLETGGLRVIGSHRLVIGPGFSSGETSGRQGREVVAAFVSADVNATYTSNIRAARWQKLAWSLVFAGPCTLLNVDTRDVVRSDQTTALMSNIFAEAQAVARHDHVDLDIGDFESMIADAKSEPGHLVSMTLDRRRKRPLEYEDIYGAVRDRGAEVGVPTPTIDSIYQLLSFGENGRQHPPAQVESADG